jgi:hypothetical protein
LLHGAWCISFSFPHEQMSHRDLKDPNNCKKACYLIFFMANEFLSSLKAPIIEIGKSSGYNVVENYDLGAGPIDLAWIFKPGVPGLPSLPDIRIGFVFVHRYSESIINGAIAKSILNLIDKLIIVVASDAMTRQVSQSLKRDLTKPSLLQLRKYVTVLTPSTLVEKSGITSGRNKDTSTYEKSGLEVT